jgi:glucokinase
VTDELAVGVDIGGTKIAAGLVGASGLVGSVEVVATDATAGGASVLERAIALAQKVAGESSSAPVAVGVAAGGFIDPVAGRVVGATSLLPGWGGTALRDGFERALRVPVSTLNDVQAIGVAEARLGAGRGRRHCLCVAVGTGIGGAIVIDGRLFGGAHGFAGAIGHGQFDQDGALCSCGRRGCIEAVASGPEIARAFAQCAEDSGGVQPSERGGDAAADSELRDVVRALRGTDQRARACATNAVTTAGSRLGQVLGGLSNVLDPDVIVVAGGAAAALGEPFLSAIRSGVREAALAHLDPDVVPGELGTGGGVVGAGLVALDAVHEARSSQPSRA